MVVVLAAPGDEVALRVGGGEALGGDRVFHHVGASERGQRQVTVQPEARFKAHQVPQGSQEGFGVRNALTPWRGLGMTGAAIAAFRRHSRHKEGGPSGALAFEQRDSRAGFLVPFHHHRVKLLPEELFHHLFIAWRDFYKIRKHSQGAKVVAIDRNGACE